jgi:hypothetical protein
MKRYTSSEREIIRDLFESNDWVDLFVFHERYMLSAGQLAHTVRMLNDMNLLDIESFRVKLNQRGRRWVLANRHDLFLREDQRFWARRPVKSWVQEEQLDPATPYMPTTKRLQQRFFLKNRLAR